MSSLNEPILIGFCYVPPEGSKYSSEGCFIEVEAEFMNFSENTRYALVVGDMSARTAILPDFT